MADAAAIFFVVPGALGQRTGGYGYDRRIVAELRAAGRPVKVVELSGRFPLCDDVAKSSASAALATAPAGSVMVIDGLALPAFEPVIERRLKDVSTIALVHHPLALETGLNCREIGRLSAIEHVLLRAVDRIVVTSPATARGLLESGVAGDEISVVCPGTDPAPPALGSQAGPLQLLCVGSLIPRKGHLALMEALAGCAHLPWRLLCAGSLDRDAETASAVVARVQGLGLSERVTLAGELDDGLLRAAYVAADIFVLASALEGFGMAFAEALAHGLPVVGSGAGAVRETVPETAGLIVPVGNAAALRDALARIIEDSNFRQRLAAGARNAGSSLPDWPAAGRAFARALDRAVAL